MADGAEFARRRVIWAEHGNVDRRRFEVATWLRRNRDDLRVVVLAGQAGLHETWHEWIDAHEAWAAGVDAWRAAEQDIDGLIAACAEHGCGDCALWRRAQARFPGLVGRHHDDWEPDRLPCGAEAVAFPGQPPSVPDVLADALDQLVPDGGSHQTTLRGIVAASQNPGDVPRCETR